MDPVTRRNAVARHRRGLRQQGLVRLEVQASAEDAPLLRRIAAALARGADADEVRTYLRERFPGQAPTGLKALLAAAPFEDIELDRPYDTGRELEL